MNKIGSYDFLKHTARLFLILYLSVFTFQQARAQFTYTIDGFVSANKKKVEGAIVILYKGGVIEEKINTSSNGKFTFKLIQDMEYTLSVTKAGYITKKLLFSTKGIPADVLADYEQDGTKPEISIFEMPKDPSIVSQINAILSQPMAKFSFDDEKKKIVFDEAYSESMQNALLNLKKLEEESIKKLEEDAKQKAITDAAITSKYNSSISKADAAFNKKDYTSAKTAYNEALGIKPSEAYPKAKLTEIDKLIATALANDAAEKNRIAKENELNDKYNAAIAKADKSLLTKDYTSAKTAYNEALGIKPSEAYPKAKLTEIDKLLATALANDAAEKNRIAKENELNDKYNAAIAKADKSLLTKDYTSAKTAYNEALGIKPSEVYPKAKLTEIDKLLATALANDAAEKNRIAKENELNDKYNAAIAKADKAFDVKDYINSKISYNEALTYKTNERHPKEQIVKIDQFIADDFKKKELQAKYDAAIAKANTSIIAKDYTTALIAYKEAQSIKPTEQLPLTKISEINKLIDNISRNKEIELQYKDFITKGDRYLASKDFNLSKSNFQQALNLKPTEKYPKDQLVAIDLLMKAKITTTVVETVSKEDFRNELAKKYPEGITEEHDNENNVRITRRIVVKGTEGHMYLKKVTSFGPIYYFKDDSPITERDWSNSTEVKSH